MSVATIAGGRFACFTVAVQPIAVATAEEYVAIRPTYQQVGRPLERVRVARTEDGQLLVDVGVFYRQENGDWDKPGSFLRT